MIFESESHFGRVTVQQSQCRRKHFPLLVHHQNWTNNIFPNIFTLGVFDPGTPLRACATSSSGVRSSRTLSGSVWSRTTRRGRWVGFTHFVKVKSQEILFRCKLWRWSVGFVLNELTEFNTCTSNLANTKKYVGEKKMFYASFTKNIYLMSMSGQEPPFSKSDFS